MNKFKLGKNYIYWGLTAFFVVIACITFFWIIQRWDGVVSSFSYIVAILSPIIGGFILAYILTPFVKFFQRTMFNPLGKKIFKNNLNRANSFGRGISIFTSILILVLIVAALFSLVIPQLYQSIDGLVRSISSNINRFNTWANKWLDDFPTIKDYVTEFLGNAGTNFSQWAKETLLPQMQDVISSVSAGVLTALKLVSNIFVAMVVSVYVMFSREKFIAQSKKILYSVLSLKQVKNILTAIKFTDKSFRGFFSGQLLDALIVGIVCYIGCSIIGIQDAVLVSVIIGMTNVIPFFGPFIGAVPSTLIILMRSSVHSVIFVVFIIILQQIDGNILSPKILGSKTGLSGFWVLFAILVGAGLMGFVGMIISVPIFAVFYAGIKYFVNRRLEKRGLPEGTASYTDIECIDPDTLMPVFSEPLPDAKLDWNQFFSGRKKAGAEESAEIENKKDTK